MGIAKNIIKVNESRDLTSIFTSWHTYSAFYRILDVLVQLHANSLTMAYGTAFASIQLTTNLATPSSCSIFHPRPTGVGTSGSFFKHRFHMAT